MKSSAWLVLVSLGISTTAACGGAPKQGASNLPPPGVTAQPSASGTPRTGLPRGTAFQISADAAVAAGPHASSTDAGATVAYYRVQRDPSGTFFWLGSFSEDGKLIAAGRDVHEEDVHTVLSVVRKNASALKCDPSAGRAPYLTRRIDVEGDIEVHVQTDCRGVYPDEASSPAEVRAFQRGLREVEDAMLALVHRLMPPKRAFPKECRSHADCPGGVCVQRSACSCGGAAQSGSICLPAEPACKPCTGTPVP